MEYTIIAWLLISLIIGIIGDKRKIGFGGAFLFSIFLSPIMGAIFIFQQKKVENLL